MAAGFPGIEKYRSVISVGPGSAAKSFAGDFPGRQVERLWASYRGLPSPLVVRPGAAVIGPRSVPLTASAAAKETKGGFLPASSWNSRFATSSQTGS